MKIQEDTRGYRRIQEDTRGYKRIQKDTGGYRRIQEDTGGIHEDTGGYEEYIEQTLESKDSLTGFPYTLHPINNSIGFFPPPLYTICRYF